MSDVSKLGCCTIAYAMVPIVVCLHLFLAPYTKVEESHNMQAVHDVLYHRFELDEYDYREFPGAVPRTFIGALVTAITAAPFSAIGSMLNFPKIAHQYLARLALGLMCSLSFFRVQQAVAVKFGRRTGFCFGLLLVSQFHLLFYASRLLPNTFALILSNLALANLISEDNSRNIHFVIFYLTFGAAIFRCDLILLIIPVALMLLLLRRIKLTDLVVSGFFFSTLAVLLTVLIDSVFWGRVIWPELEVFLFNNPVDNRSAQWGVSSYHWYFTSALPKSLSGATVFMLLGIFFERRVRSLAVVAVSYMLLFSLLPHKEVRFIFPVLPYLNVVAATGLDRMFKLKGHLKVIASLFSLAVITLSFIHLYIATVASSMNYPGGYAFKDLHKGGINEQGKNIAVHIGNLAAISGVTRFGEEYENWTYSKEENIDASQLRELGFDYVLSESNQALRGYKLLKQIHGFHHIEIPRDLQGIKEALLARGVPVLFRTSPQLFLHKLK